MRSRPDFIEKRLRMHVAKATDVLLKWEEFATGATVDPLYGGKTGTVVPKTLKAKALIHFPNIASSQVRIFAEIEQGDCIADFAGDVELDGKENLRFVINGEEWVQKKVGAALAKSWDLVIGNARMARTVLLKKAT